MTPRHWSRSAVLPLALSLALLPGCSPHRQAEQAQTGKMEAGQVQAGQTRTPVAPLVTAADGPGLVQGQAQAAPVTPFRELNLGSLRRRVPVLTYHGVIGSRTQKDAVWFDCTLPEFEAQMKFLHDQGAQVVTLQQLQRHLTLGEPLPDKAIALTFDDSYQGVYDLAVPVLKRYGYPYAVFVHTDYVGSQKGRPKMSWEELRELDASGLATIGSHTRSHPADMGLLTTAQQDDELQGSKKILEQQLGHPVPYISYPNGKADGAAFGRARLAGYTLGFMEEWGPVEQSPGILALNRYIHLQLPRAWAENYGLGTEPATLPEGRELALAAPGAETVNQTTAAGVRLTLASGGTLQGQLMNGVALDLNRLTRIGPQVLSVPVTSHAVGGLPLGPYLERGGVFVPETDADRLTLIQGRPLVAWNAQKLAFLPFSAGTMNTGPQLAALLPGLKGVFVAGAWLVQGGRAMSGADILQSGTSDLRTLRRRVFLGVTAAGVPVLGVSAGTVNARQLALAVAAAGLQDAVLVY
ncbi:polysaccharide deacetylase family protein [Deinococcus altitudinis]|uniref:polysaccharide deacetylase family protein n=1 Tax=Deinococcus altitudinis TaxID=468914 RepID=UPI0038918974